MANEPAHARAGGRRVKSSETAARMVTSLEPYPPVLELGDHGQGRRGPGVPDRRHRPVLRNRSRFGCRLGGPSPALRRTRRRRRPGDSRGTELGREHPKRRSSIAGRTEDGRRTDRRPQSRFDVPRRSGQRPHTPRCRHAATPTVGHSHHHGATGRPVGDAPCDAMRAVTQVGSRDRRTGGAAHRGAGRDRQLRGDRTAPAGPADRNVDGGAAGHQPGRSDLPGMPMSPRRTSRSRPATSRWLVPGNRDAPGDAGGRRRPVQRCAIGWTGSLSAAGHQRQRGRSPRSARCPVGCPRIYRWW